MKTITVKVTKKDIENGKPQTCDECPIALAIQRALRDPFAYVMDDYVITSDLEFEKAHLPDVARRFVQSFDRFGHNREYKPFSFRLKIP